MDMTGRAPAPRVALLLRLYPRAWRERYEDELLALLEQHRATPMTWLSFLFCAVDAHLDPYFLDERLRFPMLRVRRSAITIFCAYILFVLAGMGFQKMSEYDDFMSAGQAHPIIGVSYDVIYVGSAVALLAVLAGGVPLALAALRYAFANRRWDIPALLCVPVLAFLAFVSYIALITRAPAPTPPNSPHDPTNVTHFFGLITILLVGALVSAAAVSLAIARSEIPFAFYRFSRVPALVTTLAMAAMLIATVIWGMGLRADVPALFNGSDGVLATSTAASWLSIVASMLIATLIAVIALVRSFRPSEGVPAAKASMRAA